MASTLPLLLAFLVPVASLREQGDGWSLSSKQEVDNIFNKQSDNRATTGQSLFGDRYTTSSDVRDIIALGKDAAAMNTTEDFIETENIYRNGTASLYGTLASLSLTTTEKMMEEPLLTIYSHFFNTKGLQNGEENGYYKGQKSQFYADAIISDLFDRDATGVPQEATLALHIWMAAAHELNNVLIGCNSHYNSTESAIALDRAAALWTGAEDRFSLYQLAQSSGEKFGQLTDEARVNTQIVNGFNSIQRDLLSGGLCTRSSEAKGLHDEVYRMIDLMTVPLIQNLIHYVLSRENGELAHVYLSAVLPHVLACDPNMASALDVESFDSMEAHQALVWVNTLQKAFSCFRLECENVGLYALDPNYPACQDSSNLLFAGYEASVSDSESYSRIDRDLLRLEILLRGGADGSVLDLYRYGHFATFPLQKLAVNDVIPRTAGSLFDQYRLFYGEEEDSFVDQQVKRALLREDEFEESTTNELVEVVMGLLSYETSFLSVMAALDKAGNECKGPIAGLNMTTMKFWDVGAALYVGSMEGGSRGGQTEGRLLFAASKRLCPLFDTCFEDNSRINNLILEAFTLGKSYLLQGQCSALTNLIQDLIFPALQSLLIEGALAYGAASAFGDPNLDGARYGRGHAFARAILPQLHEANNETSTVVESLLLLPYIRDLTVENFYEAMDALRSALPEMATDCQSVGTLQAPMLTLCEPIGQQLSSSQISFGRYVFSNEENADQVASIALDVRDMARAVSIDEAQQIYTEGRNAFLASPLRTNIKVSLASFSRDAATFMSEDPLFNIYKFAFYEEEAFDTDQMGPFSFADDHVQKFFSTSNDTHLAVESAVVLNLWMMISHHLYNAVRACGVKGNTVFHIDAAVALWIGKEQGEGSFSEGWLIYSMAQAAAKGFGQEEKEALINSQLMDAFNSLKSTSSSCKNDDAAHLKVRSEVHSTIRLLSVPLMQQLFIAIASNDQAKVSLYARSVIPQCAGCHPQIHSELSDFLMEGFSAESIDEKAIENISVFLRCMEMSCEDFSYTKVAPNSLKQLVTRVCNALSDENQTSSLLSYPTFLSASRIDLDILQIDIFMRTRAYAAALDWYQNGHNTRLRVAKEDGSLLTLQQLATLQSKASVEHLQVFDDYHGSSNYSDGHVMEVIHQEGLYRNASRIQLAADVSTSLQATVSYQGITWNLQQAVISCKNATQDSAAGKLWTTAVALFTGSTGLHSSSDRGSSFAFNGIGRKLCEDFDSCTQDGDSQSNQALTEALHTGYSFMVDKKCVDAEDLIQSTIIPLLQVPLIQGTLKGAVFHSDEAANLDLVEEEFSSGYIMAQTLLPFVADVNDESAQTIASTFGSPLDWIPSHEQTAAIFVAFQNAIPEMSIDCTLLGNSIDEPSLAVCQKSTLPVPEETSSDDGLSPGAISGIVLVILAIGVMAFLLYWRKKHGLGGRSNNLSGLHLNGTTSKKSLDDNSVSSESYKSNDKTHDRPPSSNTMETPPGDAVPQMERLGFDPESIDISYRDSPTGSLSFGSLSRKASRMLSRIMQYGDDVTTNVLLEDTSSTDRRSTSQEDGQKPILKRVSFLVDDDGDII